MSRCGNLSNVIDPIDESFATVDEALARAFTDNIGMQHKKDDIKDIIIQK